MSKRFSERILDFLRQPEYRPMEARRLARTMGIAEAEYGDFHDAVDALRRVGRVVLGSGNAVMLPQPRGEVVGTYRANPRGFGFVVPDQPTVHGDLFIAPGASLDAVTGDTVLCRVVRRGKREGKEAFGGQIIRVIKRGNSRFVGQLRQEGGIWFVQPDGNTLHVPIMVGDVGAKACHAGDQVVVEIIRYPSEGKPAKGVIAERLGKSGQVGVDLLSIIRQYDLPDEFSDEAMLDARAASDSFDADAAMAERVDLSDQMIITIDPDDARDFDDAISLERLKPASGRAGGAKGASKRGGEAVWELGVHIADVSTFVREGGALNEEAGTRGTSVYFPGFVVPMLPEVLSNGLCSLQEGEPRLCKSVFIRYDHAGNVAGTRFANTVIRSTKRLTYREATAVLEGKKGRLPKNVVDLLQRMDALARIIQRRRLAEGMIVLELPEVELIFNENGQVTDAQPADTSFSHTIIEMFMVEANEAVARLLEGLSVPFLRRVHGEPDEASLEALAKMLRAAGWAVPKKLAPEDLQRLLTPMQGKPEGYALSLAVLKSMQMAEYSPAPIGHFALGSKCYTHFTSPIRRYPDLMVHRLLELHLTRQLKAHKRGGHEGAPDEVELKDWGRRLSFAARQAENAEREYRTLKILQLLTRKIGDEFEGVVTGVTNFGLFVQHPRFLIDGLLRLENMTDDWWEVDMNTGRVSGERTRQVFAMGSKIKVRIAEVDLSARQLGLRLGEEAMRKERQHGPSGRDVRGDRARGKSKKRKGESKRGRYRRR
ncbi:MAG TPA: ribonuclease R [Phycisphaerae bacterium]|nr:ribonuclease R [Phycisphaerae bacterium]